MRSTRTGMREVELSEAATCCLAAQSVGCSLLAARAAPNRELRLIPEERPDWTCGQITARRLAQKRSWPLSDDTEAVNTSAPQAVHHLGTSASMYKSGGR
ncbi:hypothetical protein Vretimale_1029 [Volvox reticuliferus]|uniref:Uncharacterized protein n=1 Tax=Volvox reticuliferus TaxID=1737510 RepID=A0A8J4G1E4_9CHLO|nr:hypothetical protein Vretimale_1029 [Volvox reticuliferus]